MSKYPKLYIWNEKHGDRYCIVNTKEGENTMFLDILKERFEGDWYEYYEKYSKETIKTSIEQKDSKLAKNILYYRKNYEYEGYDFEYPIIYP